MQISRMMTAEVEETSEKSNKNCPCFINHLPRLFFLGKMVLKPVK